MSPPVRALGMVGRCEVLRRRGRLLRWAGAAESCREGCLIWGASANAGTRRLGGGVVLWRDFPIQ